uniref:fas apoptotic inhibitory molecule 3 n=1 Tax=Jaculus jaculus TaxID=51337 RepID=UPI001E1B09A1|nr:fas apoptotic inhibitory molecule 3 [Jaculus jaculus]
MDLWLLLLYFFPVLGAQKILPKVQLDGVLGGSITITCPLSEMHGRMYLCRQVNDPGICVTVVSNTYVKKEYKRRITLRPCFDKNLFLVELAELTQSDNGVYACGLGMHTDRGKTQKVTLNVHSDYDPFWEDELMSESPRLLHLFPHQQMPNWLNMDKHDYPEFMSKVTTPAPKTKAPPAHQPSTTIPTTHHPPVSRASLVVTSKPLALLPPTTASKTSVEEKVKPLGAHYSHHPRFHGQRTMSRGPQYGREDQGFHILIPTVLGLLLLALLGLVVKRAIQRRKAFSRGVRRLAVRLRTDAVLGPLAQRPPGRAQRPRSQNNVYSACPRRAQGPGPGQPEAPLPNPGPSAPPAGSQVPEASWPQAPPLKTSCEYVTLWYQPAANMEDADSDNYINIPSPTHLPSCPPRPRS